MTARWAAIVMVTTVGCGRLHFDPTATSDGAACTLGPWSAPRALPELATAASEYGPWLSDDRLTIAFSSDRTGQFLTYTASRSAVDQPFAAPSVFAITGTGFADPYLSPDGLTFYADNSGAPAVLRSSRPTTADGFAMPEPIAELALGVAAFNPSLSLDQLAIVFDTTNSTERIYRATRATPAAAFTAPQALPPLAIGAVNCCPALASDNSFILIGSDAGSPGVQHIFQATANGAGFDPPVMLAETLVGGGGAIDSDPYISVDGRSLVWTSLRTPNVGSYDLYEIDRDCL